MSVVIKPNDPPLAAAPQRGLLSDLSDADLLDAWIREGSREAFAAIVDRYSVMVLSVCRRRCRTVADRVPKTRCVPLAADRGRGDDSFGMGSRWKPFDTGAILKKSRAWRP